MKYATPILLLTFLLAGCSDYLDRKETINFSTGNAVQTAFVTHVHDPWPVVARNKNIDFDGERMQRAVERYRTFDPQRSGQAPQIVINTTR